MNERMKYKFLKFHFIYKSCDAKTHAAVKNNNGTRGRPTNNTNEHVGVREEW
jgi:hypothetical protein